MHRVAKSTVRSAFQAADEQTGKVNITLPAQDFIFAQVSIVSSVMTEDDAYLIKPETSRFVNANGDTWSNESLKANFPSFIGGFNFVNHVQEPEKAVGFLADAALRRLVINREKNIYVYYVDLLVATSRIAHPELAKKILAQKIEYLSMGCESFLSICSACGHKATDETDFCDHLMTQKGKYFLDRVGQKRITAELLGDQEPGSCQFYEASWLTEPPAFGGAVRRNILPIESGSVVLTMDAKDAAKPAVQMFTGAKDGPNRKY